MDYKKFGDSVYARFDKGDEILEGILGIAGKKSFYPQRFQESEVAEMLRFLH